MFLSHYGAKIIVHCYQQGNSFKLLYSFFCSSQCNDYKMLDALFASALFYNSVESWLYFTHQNVKFDLDLPPFGIRFPSESNLRSRAMVSIIETNECPNEKLKNVSMFQSSQQKQWLIQDPELMRHITIRDFSYFFNKIDSLHLSLINWAL